MSKDELSYSSTTQKEEVREVSKTKWYEKKLEEMSDEDKKAMRNMEAYLQLGSMKVGEEIRDIHIDAIKHFFGEDFFNRMPKGRVATIHFNKLGQPMTLDTDVFDTTKGAFASSPKEEKE